MREIKPHMHGTVTGYAYGCREECCRAAVRVYQRVRRQAGNPNYRPREPKPELTAAWKFAYARGVAGQFCDRIVASREVPEPLLAALGLLSDEKAA